MQMQEIRGIAKEYGLKTARMSKVNLVREIQAVEGNFACFATATDGYCDQDGCIWRKDCLSAAKKQAN